MGIIERLKELEAKATPGLWASIEQYGVGLQINRYIRYWPSGTDQFYDGKADVKLIAEMRNALPKLLAFVEAFDEWNGLRYQAKWPALAQAREALEEPNVTD